MQAIGFDARGRKQYRYHADYRAIRDETKYSKLAFFGRLLPSLRCRIETDLAAPGMPRRKVLAAVVRLLESTSIRVGNEEYARANESFGLTTLRDHHVQVQGKDMIFNFKGKSGMEHTVELSDARLARIVAKSQELPGEDLFQYVDEEGSPAKICSDDVNAYLREISSYDLTAKDFRTWNGSREALVTLHTMGLATSEQCVKHNIAAAIRHVSSVLRNRPATCRKYYVHPAVLEAYGQLPDALTVASVSPALAGLAAAEIALLGVIERYAPFRLRSEELHLSDESRKLWPVRCFAYP